MFTKEDFMAYFDQLERIEIHMHDVYAEIHDRISHPGYKQLFAQLMRDESGHEEMIKELRSHFEP